MLNSYAPLEIVSCAVGDKHNRYSGAENNDESAKVIDENYLAHPMYPQLHLNARCSRHCLVLRSSQSIAQASANASEAAWLAHAQLPTSRLIILTILLQTDMCSGTGEMVYCGQRGVHRSRHPGRRRRAGPDRISSCCKRESKFKRERREKAFRDLGY